MAKRKRDPVQGNVPLATQAALQDKTLRPPVKKMKPPLKPYVAAYKEAVGPMQEEGAWYNPVQQLPADETDVALMVLPIPFLSRLSKPMRGFAEKLLESNTVKSGTDVVLSHMANLGLTKKDLSKFYDDLITADIEVSSGGKEEIFKGVHKQAISEAQQKIASKSGTWPDYKRGEQILKAGAKEPLPPDAKYDLLGKKVDTGQGDAVPKGIKDVNQPGVDEAFDAAKRQQNKEMYEGLVEPGGKDTFNVSRRKARFGKASNEKLLERYEKAKSRAAAGDEKATKSLADFEAEISDRGIDFPKPKPSVSLTNSEISFFNEVSQNPADWLDLKELAPSVSFDGKNIDVDEKDLLGLMEYIDQVVIFRDFGDKIPPSFFKGTFIKKFPGLESE
tara:strand:- start:4981 stop:6150 length:1170 start_codon:yes stop_codon:yes gene_type:complete